MDFLHGEREPGSERSNYSGCFIAVLSPFQCNNKYCELPVECQVCGKLILCMYV